MSFVYIAFFVVAVANGLPDYGILEEDIVVDMVTREFITLPASANKQQQAEALIVGSNIKKMIEEAIENIPDPVKLPDQNLLFPLGNVVSIAVSTHGVKVEGLSGIRIETLNINLLNPFRPRITYKFVLDKLVICIDSILIKLDILGYRFNCYIKGQIFILNSSVQGTATINARTQTVTELTTIFHFGKFYSTLVGSVNSINITNLLAVIVTDIIPQILNASSHYINEAVSRIILEWL